MKKTKIQGPFGLSAKVLSLKSDRVGGAIYIRNKKVGAVLRGVVYNRDREDRKWVGEQDSVT